MDGFSLLSALIALPALGAVAICFIPRDETKGIWSVGILVSLLVFLLSIPLVSEFSNFESGFQFTQDFDWIASIHARWQVGLDGISLWIVILTTFLTPLILIGSLKSITHRVREFVIAMLFLETAMIGALVATDLLLFFLFWEMMLVPMYLLIGIWGGKERLYATIKFFIYTVVGSLLMLVGIIYLYNKSGSFEYAAVLALDLTGDEQFWLFTAFALAFLIKVPVFPFHTWLPDAHTQAPTAGSVVLAGILLKMGTYGLVRFAVPLFPSAMATYSPLILCLAVIGIIYGALLAFAQNDVKKLIAYSSVSHLGFVMLGVVALNETSVQGAILQMINHGVSTGALFLLIGMIYERTHTRQISDYGGIAAKVPIFTVLFIIVTMSSVGLPTTNGFVGEFLILSGAFAEGLPLYRDLPLDSWPILMVGGTILATTGVVLGAVYMLTVVRRVFFGPITRKENEGLKDLSLREIGVVAPLIIFIFVIGLAPNMFLAPMDASVRKLVSETRPIVTMQRDKERLSIRAKQMKAGQRPRPVSIKALGKAQRVRGGK